MASLFGRIKSLFSPSGQAPVSTRRYVPSASRDAGAFRDPIAGWRGPQISNTAQEAREREVSQRRAGDLAANDWAAGSALSAVTQNAIGTGLLPKAAIPADILKISPEEAARVGREMEWAFARWACEADIRGLCHFHDLQLLGLRSMLAKGEMLQLAVMLSDKDRASQNRLFSLALQAIRPERLQTPQDMTVDPYVRDGIRFTASGRPQIYYIANPQVSALDAFATTDTLLSSDFSAVPGTAGRRRLVFHLFRHEVEEQTRGFSVFSPGIALFRNLSDALNYELFAQVMAASFPVFIETEDPSHPPLDMDDNDDGGERFHEIRPGNVYYGANNQKPITLESKRPSANFASFVEIILRAMAASQGIPYESLAKDYSRTNYSSMRAALNEAWKLYSYYRQWFARSYCQPIWQMLQEEAILRGYVKLPKGAPAFESCPELWCNASWVGPARGFVDPVKEIQSIILALQNGLMTYGEAWAERGGDFDEGAETMLAERKILENLGLSHEGSALRPSPAKVTVKDQDDNPEEENEQENEQNDNR